VYSVVQPIVRLDDRVIIGYEALARVESETNGSPDWWLNQVDDLGLRTDLEVMFLESAARLGPPPGDALLFVNVSPGALAHPGLLNLRWELPDRLVIEITEQTAVDDYSALKARLEQWSVRHARVAIDDTGAGYSSLRHVIELAPDFLKLDRTLITDIEKDSSRQALVRALVAFSREVGTTVIAEGIETTAELAALSRAGITLGQGFLFGRPGPAWPDVDRQQLPGQSPRCHRSLRCTGRPPVPTGADDAEPLPGAQRSAALRGAARLVAGARRAAGRWRDHRAGVGDG
jgi:EAL domain-containing protein (putative c-di-GMP-specific phosphodiesterase class I)